MVIILLLLCCALFVTKPVLKKVMLGKSDTIKRMKIDLSSSFRHNLYTCEQGCGVDEFLGDSDSDSDSDSDPRSRLRLRLRLRDRLRPSQYHELIKDNRSKSIFCIITESVLTLVGLLHV